MHNQDQQIIQQIMYPNKGNNYLYWFCTHLLVRLVLRRMAVHAKLGTSVQLIVHLWNMFLASKSHVSTIFNNAQEISEMVKFC